MPATPVPPPLTPRFQRLLALASPPFGRPKPTATELEAIRGVLAEGPTAATRLNLGQAMCIAADNAPDDETASLIAKILNDANADASLRRQAAAALGDIPRRSASKALIDALAGSSAGLEATLLKSLAQVGDAEAERIIARREPTVSVRLVRLRDFARAAILLRLGAPVDERAEQAILPTAVARAAPAGVELAVTDEPPAEIEATIRRFRGSTYGLRFNPQLGYAFECGNARHLVLLSSELQRGSLLASLGAKRRIAGLVAIQDETGEQSSYLARRLIVTRPTGDGIDVSIVGPGGEVDLVGNLRPRGTGYVLTLRTYDEARRPTAVDGVVSEDGLVLNLRTLTGGPSGKRHGEIDPSAA
jgi:hypothetical protein